MFQNISEEQKTQNEYVEINEGKIKNNIIKSLSIEKIFLYIIAFMVSMVSFGEDMMPFGIAIFAATCASTLPAGIVYIVSLIGTFIGFGKSGAFIYLLTSLAFILMTLLFGAKKTDEDVNEKSKLGLYLFASVLVIQIIKTIFNTILIYDVLMVIAISLITYIFYKIFVNAIGVISNIKTKLAFSSEEILAATLLIGIAISAFGGFTILGFSIKNILSIMLVLILGWKHGVLIGSTSGIMMGLILGIIGLGEPIMIATYAVSGMFAGILSRLGKFGVIIGFVVGNLILTYVTNGVTIAIIDFREILIASLGLLFIPKDIKINIEDLFGNTKFLPVTSNNSLEESQDTIYKLNSISQAISEMADSYKEVAATTVEEHEKLDEVKEEFLQELSNNLYGLENNLLFEELINDSNKISEDIFKYLIEFGEIDNENLIKIFEKNNNYIVGFNENKKEDEPILNDIKQIVIAINKAYRQSKLNYIWESKIKENKKNISNQLDGVSKVIASLADDITLKNDEFKFEKEKIKILFIQKEIEYKDIKIQKEESGKYIITVYLPICKEENEECKIKQMQKIFTNVFDTKILIQKTICGLREKKDNCILTFMSEDIFSVQLGIARTTKEKSPVSGDSNLQTKLDDGKVLLAISDGMGSGPEARKSSKIAIKVLGRLLEAGFNKEESIKLINSTLSLNTTDDSFATLDIAVIDSYTGIMEIIKNAACPTFIKNKNEIEVIKNICLPAGILENVEVTAFEKQLKENDIIVMITDGVLDSFKEYENKEEGLKELLNQVQTDNVQKIADIILSESIDNNYGKAKDDMTVIVAKITNKKHKI